MLQSDTMSLSLVVPALLDPSVHLSEFHQVQSSNHRDLTDLAEKMKANLEQHFSSFLDHSDSKFSPLTAAVCLLNPTVPPEAFTESEQIQELMGKAEDYVALTASPVIKAEEAD